MKYLLVIALLTFIFYNSAHSQCQECEQKLKEFQQDKIILNRKLDDCKKNQPKGDPSKVKELNATIDELNEKNDKLKTQSDSLSNKLKFYIDLNNDCKNNLNSCQNQLNVCNSSINTLNQRISYLQDTINALTLKLIDFEKLSPEEKSIKKRTRIEKDIENLNIILSGKKNELDSTSRILKNTENEYKEITSQIESQNLALKGINVDIRKLELDKERLLDQVNNLTEDKERKDKELGVVVSNINNENRTLSNIKDDISNKENYLRSLNNDISKTENRLSDLKSKLPGHLTVAIALSMNWNYGAIEDKYTFFDINSWNGRLYLGYNLDYSNDKWDGRDRSTVLGLFLNYGTVSKNSIKSVLIEQNIDPNGFNNNQINQFYELEFGLVISEILQLSLGYGNQEYEITQNTKNIIKKLNYLDFTFGLQAPLYKFLDIGFSSTFQYGIDYQKFAARFGFYTTFKLDFLRW